MAESDFDIAVQAFVRDDERNSVADTQAVIPRNPRAELVLVDGLTHRRTARDPGVISLVADFVAATNR